MIKVKKGKENNNMEKPSQIIKDLKLKIPTAPSPVGSYQAFKISNKLIFLSKIIFPSKSLPFTFTTAISFKIEYTKSKMSQKMICFLSRNSI